MTAQDLLFLLMSLLAFCGIVKLAFWVGGRK